MTLWCGSIRSSVPRQKAGRASARPWPLSSRPSLCRLPPQACRRPFDHLCDSPLDFIWLQKADETSSRLCNPGAPKPSVTHHCSQQVQTHEGLPWSAFCLLRQPLPAAVQSTLCCSLRSSISLSIVGCLLLLECKLLEAKECVLLIPESPTSNSEFPHCGCSVTISRGNICASHRPTTCG